MQFGQVHHGDSLVGDRATLWLTRRSSRAFGTHLIASLLHNVDTTVDLPHKGDGRGKRIKIEAKRRPGPGLNQAPVSFSYFASAPRRHPFTQNRDVHLMLPNLHLEGSSNPGVIRTPQDDRDTLVIGGWAEALAALGELFLDAGCEDAGPDFELETCLGFGGVAGASAELSLVLPGSDLWDVGGVEV